MGFFPPSILISDPIAEGEAAPKLISESENQAEIKSIELRTPISMHGQLASIQRLLTFQAAGGSPFTEASFQMKKSDVRLHCSFADMY